MKLYITIDTNSCIRNRSWKWSIRLIILMAVILINNNTYSQAGKSTGNVRNEEGSSIPFVSISIKGTSQISTTNEDGDFFLPNIRNNDTIYVSSIGYAPLEYIIKNVAIPVRLILIKSSKELETVEVVSSGYQEFSRERATGSFTKINNATLNEQTSPNILKRLDGVTSGLLFNIGKQNNNPQNKTNISIRGLSTINGPLDPLIVLDGFIYEGNIENINPNDVDNITVLKDAAATSIWGSRAGNGVIVISTKRGKFDQPLQIGLSANTMVSGKPDLFNLPNISSSDYIDLEEFLFNKGYFNDQINSFPNLALTPASEVFLKRRIGEISSGDSMQMINSLKKIDSRNEYLSHFYTNPITEQYSVNLRGGSQNTTYFFSAGYDKMLSEMYDKSGKLNLKTENTYNPVKNLYLTLSAYYTSSEMKSGRGLSYNAITINSRNVPYLRFLDDSGELISISPSLSDSYTDTVGGGMLLNWKYYPTQDYKYNETTTNLQELNANIGLRYKISEYIDIEFKYQYQKQQVQIEQLSEVESFRTKTLINFFSELDRSTGTVKYNIPLGAMRYLDNAETDSYTGRGQLNFNKKFKQHEVNALIGSDLRQAQRQGGTSTLYGYNSDPLKYSAVDFVNTYPISISGAYDYIPGAPSVSPLINNRFISFFANGAYTFQNKYTLSASVRRDGSNIFGLTTNDKWKPLWSVGGAWILSKEKFYTLGALSYLKLRLTYGKSGNVDLSKSALAVGRYSTINVTNLPITQIITINNPELRWEQTGTLNIGVDYSSKNNRISGSIEYYKKKAIDLYGPTPYDYTTWGATRNITTNVGNMVGNGIDIIITTKNLKRKFKWNSTILFNYNTDKTTKYDIASAQRISGLLSAGSAIFPVVGKPLYAIAAYRWGGLDEHGNPQGYLDNKLSTDYDGISQDGINKGIQGSIEYIGPANPTVFGSLINVISWKRFSFSANLSYKTGYYFRKSSLSYSGLIIYGGGHKDYEKRWQNPGDELKTNVPSFAYPYDGNRDLFYSRSSANVLKGDHVRLQYVNFSYSIPTGSSLSTKFKELQITFNADNLGILWRANREKLDPDYSTSIPSSKSFALGIRTNF